MAFFTSNEVTSHTIHDDEGNEATINVRALNSGDQAVIQDSIKMSIGDNPEPDIKIGAFRLLMVERALVSWSLDLPVSPNTIRQLEPSVFEQIFNIVNGSEEEAPLDEAS